MVTLKHLMGSDQFTLQGAVRGAIWLIGQAPERSRWAGLAHLKGRFFALAGLCYVPLVVNQDHGAKRALPANAKNRSNASM